MQNDKPLYYGIAEGPLRLRPSYIALHVNKTFTYKNNQWIYKKEDLSHIAIEHRTIDDEIPICPQMLRKIPSQTENSDLYTFWTDGYRSLGIGNMTVDSLLSQDLQPDYTLLKEK